MATNYDGAVQIARSPNFMNRTEYALVEVAQEVLSEPLATQYHSDRLAYAQSLLRAEIDRARVLIAAISIVVGNESILDPNADDHGVSDGAVSNAIRNNWNDLAGIEQGT